MLYSVKLTKSLVNGGRLDISENYVSNGHWLAVKSKFVDQFALKNEETAQVAFKDVATLKDSTAEDILKRDIGPSTKYFKTKWSVDFGYKNGKARAFISEGKLIFIDENYLPLLEAQDNIYSGGDGTAAYDAEKPEERAIIIMPIKIDADNALPAMSFRDKK